MPVPDFLFSMTLAGRDDVDQLLGDVAVQAFRSAGCASAAIDELVQAMKAAVTPGAGSAREFNVQVRATDGSVEVVVRQDNRDIWRASCPEAQDANS